MLTDHWSKGSLGFLKQYLVEAKESLQVATGYFTIQGYDLIRSETAELWVRIMVGFDEDSKEKLRELLIENIMLYLSRWDAENRREAVLELVERIKKGRFQIVEHREDHWLDARARKKDHGKVYIVDEKWVLSGSVNLTVNGLKFNSENLTAVEKPSRVTYYIEQFQKYWNEEDTIDLTQTLLDALLAWLTLAPPFDVYLKTIQVLIPEDDTEAPRESYKMPVNYQMVVIQRILRQLKAFRGAMLVASTGLGKTIMATHIALRLRKEKQIYNVMVFCPLQVQPEWKYAMRSAGIGSDIFTRNLLDQPSGRGKKMREMEEALEQVDHNYLIIIDESQYFRNRRKMGGGGERQSFNRLIPVIQRTKALVLLLTATPYSREVSDLNNQLRLLPHTAEKVFVRENGQYVFAGMVDDDIAPEAWRVMDQQNFFEEFIRLPVATVISTSQVAKDFAEHSEEGDSILFGEQRRWVPQVEITKVKVPVFLEKRITDAMAQRVFDHEPVSFRDRRQRWRRSKVIVQNQAEVSWMSSPRALEKVIRDALSDKYQVAFYRNEEARRELLEPILDNIRSFDLNDDPKFQALVFYLKRFQAEGRKVIVFTERQATAVYLENAISKRLPFLKVACTVSESEGETSLKDFYKEVIPLIKGFAPEANADKISPREKLVNYDLLIATDAYSTGVNLQDASVVINYDLAWTPDVLIQRAGRILRFWKQPRRVHFLVFVGDFRENQTGRQNTHKVEDRLRRLSSRSKDAQRFSEIPIIPDQDKESYQSLGNLSEVSIEDIGLVDVSQLEEFSGVSPFLRHIAVLKENEKYANQIPDDIASAMYYAGNKRLLYLLLLKGEEYFHVIYDIGKKSIEPIKEDALLDLIQCTAQTQTAHVGADEVEKLAQIGKKLWLQQNGFSPDQDVERICALYLIPQRMRTEFRALIER